MGGWGTILGLTPKGLVATPYKVPGSSHFWRCLTRHVATYLAVEQGTCSLPWLQMTLRRLAPWTLQVCLVPICCQAARAVLATLPLTDT